MKSEMEKVGDEVGEKRMLMNEARLKKQLNEMMLLRGIGTEGEE